MCLSCDGISKTLISAFFGSWFTFCYLVIETITFAILLSFSIGIASFFSFMKEMIFAHPLSSNTHGIISMLCATILGEFVKLCQRDSTYRASIRQQKQKHPIIVGKIPSLIGYSLGLLGFMELYIQYKAAHPSKFFQTGIVDRLEFDPAYDPDSLDPNPTWKFLLSLCYISYSVVRGSDWMSYRLQITALQRSQITGKCTTYTVFMIVELFLLLFYSIPLYFIVLFCHSTSIHPDASFIISTLSGIILGANVVQLEGLYPFPRQPLLPPGYEFENHLSSRVQVLILFLFPLACTAYYEPGKLYTSLSAGDKYILFCLATSITAVQMTKVLFDFRVFDWLHQIRRQQREFVNEPNANLDGRLERLENEEIIIEINPHISSLSCNMNKKATLSKTVQVEPDENQNNNNGTLSTETSEIETIEIVKPTLNVIVSEPFLPVISDENQSKSEQLESYGIANSIEKKHLEENEPSCSDE